MIDSLISLLLSLCIPLLYVTNALVENYLCQGAISGLIDLKESSTSRMYRHDEFYGASSRSIYNLWRESPVQKTGGTFGGNTTKTNVTYRCSLANCKVAFMHKQQSLKFCSSNQKDVL